LRRSGRRPHYLQFDREHSGCERNPQGRTRTPKVSGQNSQSLGLTPPQELTLPSRSHPEWDGSNRCPQSPGELDLLQCAACFSRLRAWSNSRVGNHSRTEGDTRRGAPTAGGCVGRCVRSRLAEVRFLCRWGGPEQFRSLVCTLRFVSLRPTSRLSPPPPRSAPPFLECSSSLSQTVPPSTSLLPDGSLAPVLSEELSCDLPCWRSS
jgi:hypothetical protein